LVNITTFFTQFISTLLENNQSIPKIISNYNIGGQIKSTRNFLFSINRGQFTQTGLVVTNSLVGVKTIKLASRKEIGNSRCLTQSSEMNE